MSHFLPWSQKYESGIQEVDLQHQHLFYLVDQMFTAIEINKPQKDLQELLTKLADYARWHVKEENDVIKHIDTLDTESHQKRDEEFLNLICTCATEYCQNNIVIDRLILRFLKSWILLHILIDDKDIRTSSLH